MGGGGGGGGGGGTEPAEMPLVLLPMDAFPPVTVFFSSSATCCIAFKSSPMVNLPAVSSDGADATVEGFGMGADMTGRDPIGSSAVISVLVSRCSRVRTISSFLFSLFSKGAAKPGSSSVRLDDDFTAALSLCCKCAFAAAGAATGGSVLVSCVLGIGGNGIGADAAGIN